jgi:hypothetical protein
METGVLVIQYLLYATFAFHFLWRLIHDLNATNAWKKRSDMVCGPFGASSGYYQPHPHADINWTDLHQPANEGINSAAVFWLLGILPIL